MTDKELVILYRQALEDIVDFGHAKDCDSNAPIHECCCYDMDEKDIAYEALNKGYKHDHQ